MCEPEQNAYTFEQLGDTDGPARALDTSGIADAELARVVRLDRGLPLVVSARGTYRGEPSNALLKRMKRDALLRPAVGDWVALTHPEDHETARIEAILPRTSAFIRKDPGEQTTQQVILANVDIVFIVTALGEEPVNIARLERKLVLVFESGARPVIVLTKEDRCDNIVGELTRIKAVAGEVPVIVTSALTGEGTSRLREMVGSQTTAAMIGSSGVGKSTLINCLIGQQRQATATVRETDDKGRHTTVAREIIVVPQGGILIDTPGMRAVALWQASKGLALAYPEITSAATRCRFANCTHHNESECGVKAALDDGQIDPARFGRYRRLCEELEMLDEKREEKRRATRETRPHGRGSFSHQVAKAKRNQKKFRGYR